MTALFRAALEAKVPHNYFALWMMTPARELSGARPVDRLNDTGRLVRLLQAAAGAVSVERRWAFSLSGPPDTIAVKDS